jgi:glycosyltransferase involved in cell wall biosynthesis
MVIVVDDGSSHGQAVESGEKTAAQFEGIFMSAGNFATVLSYPENHGKGYAMKTAFRHIKDNYHGNFTVVVIDVLSNMIGITPLLAKLGTELVMFFFSFFMQKHFVFKKQPVAEKKTQPPFQNAAAA